jgi:DNA-binding beta-propeller fold protein YncE
MAMGLRFLAGVILAAQAGLSLAVTCDGSDGYEAAPAVHLNAWHGFLHTPTRLAIDASDNVYITDPARGRIVVRAVNGQIVKDMQGFDYPVSVAVDGQRRMYVGEGSRGRVDVYGADGKREGALGDGDGEFGLPGHMAIDEGPGGVRVYVSDAHADEVRAYDADSGVRLLTIGGTGSGQGRFVFPSGIAVAGDELFVVDRGNSRIQVFDLDGAFSRVIAPTGDDCGFLCAFDGASVGRARDAGLHVTPGGFIYLTESSKGRVLVLDPAGEAIGAIGEYGTAPGRLRVASDVVVDSCGRVLVASAANARVELFGLPGHTDPETVSAARLTLQPEQLDATRDRTLTALVEIPGERLEEVTDAIANGFAQPVSARVADLDRDNRPELILTFGEELVQALLDSSDGTVIVTGEVGERSFEASTNLAFLVADADGDGVDDPDDACADTRPRATVNHAGCSVAQLCPCAAPVHGQPRRQRFIHLRCVIETLRSFVRLELISRRAAWREVRRALHDTCDLPTDVASEVRP